MRVLAVAEIKWLRVLSGYEAETKDSGCWPAARRRRPSNNGYWLAAVVQRG